MSEKWAHKASEDGGTSSCDRAQLNVPSASGTISKHPAICEMDSAAMRAFSCAICLENFDKEVRYPVSLLCGHTFCSKCLKTMGKHKPTIMCGVCRKHTRSSYKRLGKNILLIDLMEKSRLLAETNEVDTQQMSDTASSVGSEHGGGGGGNRHRASSPSLFNNEGLEELYEMLDSIEDSINLAPNEELVRSRALRLESLRDEIGRLEGKIGEAQRDYDSLAERARQMEAEVTTTSDQWEQAEERRRVLFNTLMRLRPYQQRQHRGFGNREYVDVWGLDDDLSSTGAGGDDSHLDVPFPTLLLMAQGQSRGRWLNNNYMRFDESSRIHCYLCDCYFHISLGDDPDDISLNEDIRRHIRGQRHQNLLRENIQGPPSGDYGQSTNFPSMNNADPRLTHDQPGSNHSRLSTMRFEPVPASFGLPRMPGEHVPITFAMNQPYNSNARNDGSRPVFVGDDLISFYDEDDNASVDSTGLGHIAGFNRQIPNNPLDATSTELAPRASSNFNSIQQQQQQPQQRSGLVSSIWNDGLAPSPHRYTQPPQARRRGTNGFSNFNFRPSSSSTNNGNNTGNRWQMGQTSPRRQHQQNSSGGRGRPRHHGGVQSSFGVIEYGVSNGASTHTRNGGTSFNRPPVSRAERQVESRSSRRRGVDGMGGSWVPATDATNGRMNSHGGFSGRGDNIPPTDGNHES